MVCRVASRQRQLQALGQEIVGEREERHAHSIGVYGRSLFFDDLEPSGQIVIGRQQFMRAKLCAGSCEIDGRQSPARRIGFEELQSLR